MSEPIVVGVGGSASAPGAARWAVVEEVRHADGTPPYAVHRLDTGARTLVLPGSGRARRAGARREHLTRPAPPSTQSTER